MPSYFNKSKKDSDDSGGKWLEKTDENLQEEASREMKKNLLEILMITTNKSRMEMAEEIAAEFDCTMSVSYLDELKADIKKQREFELQDKAKSEIRQQYAEYKLMKHELWKAWYKSWEDQEKVREEVGDTPKGSVDKRITTVEGRLPNYLYMKQIDEINKSIQDLLGIKQNIELNFNQQNNNFNVISNGAPKMDLVPDDHDVFTKKPKELPEASYTSIDSDDDVEVEEVPESID